MKFETLFTLDVEGLELDVESWSEYLGLTPLEVCRFGQKIPAGNSRSISLSSYWTIGIKKIEGHSINSQLSEVLDLVHPVRAKIKELSDKYSLDAGCASFAWLGEDSEYSDVDLYIEHENIKRLAELGCDLAINVYDQ